MSETSTIYDVRIQYTLDDRASQGLRGIGDAAGQAGRQTDGLLGNFKALGAMLAGGALFQAGRSAFVGFNSDMEQLRIRLGAMLRANDVADSMSDAKKQANELFAEFQKFSVQTPVTTKEIVQFSAGITASTAAVGGSRSQIRSYIKDLTEYGVVAAKAFGIDADTASRQLSEAMMGTVSNRMLFIKQLLATQKMSIDTFRGLDSDAKRRDVLRSALMSPAMQEASKEMGGSFEGVLSTFEDKLQITFGKIGLPLFKKITAEIQRWNEWIDKNEESVNRFGDAFASGLVKGFDTVKAAVGFVIDHKDTLLELAKAWLMVKATGAGGGLGGLGGKGGGPQVTSMLAAAVAGSGMQALTNAHNGATTAENRLSEATMGATAALATLPGPIGLIGQALLGMQLGVAHLESEQSANIVRAGDKASLRAAGVSAANASNFQEAIPALVKIRELGMANGQVDFGALRKAALDSSKDMFGVGDAHFADDVTKNLYDAFRVATATDREATLRFFGARATDRSESDTGGTKSGKVLGKGDVNVTINRIEVASGDPDRFAFGMIRSFDDIARNPTRAKDGLRGF